MKGMVEMKRMACLAMVGAFTVLGNDGEWNMPDVSPGHRRENVEWQLSYSYHVTDANKRLPRVLLVGDSICNGYKDGVARLLEGKANVTYWVTSKSVTDVSYLKFLSLFLEEYDYKVIHFNNGLHSLNDNPQDYEKCLRAAVKMIKAKARGAKLVWANSTPLAKEDITKRVRLLNEIAMRVMREEGVPVNDLFSLMDPLDRKEFWRDTFHFKPKAVRQQAEKVAEAIGAADGSI